MSGEDWADWENDLIVADYFAMLTDELAGRPYNKSEHRKALAALLNNRSNGSVEFKHQNISAVLKSLGETWISGYKPRFNFQNPLEEAVVRWLQTNQDWLARDISAFATTGLAETPAPLWIGPPPTMSNQPPPKELEKTQAVARKYDVAGRDERNRKLGAAGEERVLLHEKAILSACGRSDLARSIRWVSREDGDGAGFDIASFTPDGQPRLIEVKTTNGWERTPFYISRNELEVAETEREHWRLVRLWNFSRDPKAFEIQPPLDAHVSLSPETFRASFH
jgi:hypothetical protein